MAENSGSWIKTNWWTDCGNLRGFSVLNRTSKTPQTTHQKSENWYARTRIEFAEDLACANPNQTLLIAPFISRYSKKSPIALFPIPATSRFEQLFHLIPHLTPCTAQTYFGFWPTHFLIVHCRAPKNIGSLLLHRRSIAADERETPRPISSVVGSRSVLAFV